MLILPKSCFFHVPKTGGTWVKKAIIAAGIPCREFSVSGDTHIGLKHCPCPEKFKFAFVRHPLGLYRSYWQFKMTYGWDEKNQLDMTCRSDSFHQFLGNVLARFPGVYGRSLVDFVGDEQHEIEFVGKYENLVDDLVFALKSAEEAFDEQVIRSLPPSNVSNKEKFPAEYTEALEAAIMETEAEMVRRFAYL